MTIALVPIPIDHLEGAAPIWTPFVQQIAQRAHNDPAEMARMLHVGEAQAFLVWDDVKKEACAFVGVEFRASTRGRVAQIIWLMGENRASWVHLFADLETYLREQQGCVMMKAIARRGWAKLLKQSGYRETHVVFEKSVVDA